MDYPQQLGGTTFQLLGYPLETVIAEKLTAAITLGDTNTRDRDYGLITLHAVTRDGVVAALLRTAEHRGSQLTPLSEATRTLPERRRTSYAAWRSKQGEDAINCPDDFSDVVAVVCAFADSLVAEGTPGSTWDPNSRRWF